MEKRNPPQTLVYKENQIWWRLWQTQDPVPKSLESKPATITPREILALNPLACAPVLCEVECGQSKCENCRSPRASWLFCTSAPHTPFPARSLHLNRTALSSGAERKGLQSRGRQNAPGETDVSALAKRVVLAVGIIEKQCQEGMRSPAEAGSPTGTPGQARGLSPSQQVKVPRSLLSPGGRRRAGSPVYL